MNQNIKKTNRKAIIFIIVSILIITIGVSLAFFAQGIVGSGTESTLVTKDLRIIFTDSSSISQSNLEPGWTSSKTFTVENKSNTSYEYNIVIKNFINTYQTSGYLKYSITSTNGGYNLALTEVPKQSTESDYVVAYSVSIPAGVTQTYTVYFEYPNDPNVSQNDDMGKEIGGTLAIEKYVDPYEKSGTLAYAITHNVTTATRDSFNDVFTTNGSGKLYTTTEQVAGDSTAKTVYYYAGTETSSSRINNWVKFAGFYWRIIRTNADGSIRLLYHGTSTDSTESYITYNGATTFEYSTSDGAYNDPMYVGWMWGTTGSLSNNRGNTTSSYAKQIVESWYQTNIASNATYSSKVSTTAVYCNDRSESSSTATFGSYTTDTSTTFMYAASERLGFYDKDFSSFQNATVPSYNCTTAADAFTASNSSNIGNGDLTYPVALMTADELSYAGGRFGSEIKYVWYRLNSSFGSTDKATSSTGSNNWLTMSPAYWGSGFANVFAVNASTYPGQIGYGGVGYTCFLRPVVSVNANVTVTTGDGSSSTPYEI